MVGLVLVAVMWTAGAERTFLCFCFGRSDGRVRSIGLGVVDGKTC